MNTQATFTVSESFDPMHRKKIFLAVEIGQYGQFEYGPFSSQDWAEVKIQVLKLRNSVPGKREKLYPKVQPEVWFLMGWFAYDLREYFAFCDGVSLPAEFKVYGAYYGAGNIARAAVGDYGGIITIAHNDVWGGRQIGDPQSHKYDLLDRVWEWAKDSIPKWIELWKGSYEGEFAFEKLSLDLENWLSAEGNHPMMLR